MLYRSIAHNERSKAAAPVEFVLFLPFLLILLLAMVVFTVIVFRMYEVSQRARYDAWSGSDVRQVDIGITDSRSTGLGRIAKSAAWDGLVESVRSRYQPLPRWFSTGDSKIEARYRLLTGTWDHGRIRFPERESLQVGRHFGVHENESGLRSLEAIAENLRQAGE